jgi:uncharacterized lipoprotein YmbA
MMKKLLVIVLAVILSAAIVYAAGPEFAKKAGSYDVAAKFERNPSVGLNNLDITVKDSSGNYITDATIKVDYSMPAMAGMPAMNYKTNATPSGSTYKAQLNLSMSGSWNVAVKVIKGGKISIAKFNVDAQ